MPLATILGIDERTKISFFKKGLNGELKKALSYQITLLDIFDEFVQACIKIDNHIRAYKEARDAIPRTQGGQFAPAPAVSASTRTHSGPMDLSRARYRSQKRGPVTDQEKKRRRDNNLCLTVAPPFIGLPNAPTKDQGESPLLLPPPPLKEVCLFPLL